MLELDELFMGGGTIFIGISAAVITGIATHFLLRYLHHKSVRFLVNAFGYPIAGFILATTIYIAFDTYMPDLLQINARYYDALLVFLCVWMVYRIGMDAVDHFYPGGHHEPTRVGPVLKFSLWVVIWGFGVLIILDWIR